MLEESEEGGLGNEVKEGGRQDSVDWFDREILYGGRGARGGEANKVI